MYYFYLQRVRATVQAAEDKIRLAAYLVGGAVDEQAQLVFGSQPRLDLDDNFDVTRGFPHRLIVLG